MSELIDALNQLQKEKHIEKEVIMQAIEDSLVAACNRDFGKNAIVKVNMDRDTGDISVYVEKTVVEEVEDPATEISLADAKMIRFHYEIGDVVNIEVTPKNFGRIAAQHARSVIVQKIKEEERRVAVQNSVERTTRWLQRCQVEMKRLNSLEDTVNPHQLLFGINQGAIYEDIRIEHAKRIAEMDLDGYAVGGLAVGETHEEMYHILDEVVPYLPVNKPTYLMGVGTPANILEGVERGVDFFDCVYPTRNGRHGHLYTNHGKINLFNAKYELDSRPIEEGCGCPACQRYSRAYIRHLLKAKEMLGMRLCVLHNLYFYNTMMTEIRDALDAGRFAEYKKHKLDSMATPLE